MSVAALSGPGLLSAVSAIAQEPAAAAPAPKSCTEPLLTDCGASAFESLHSHAELLLVRAGTIEILSDGPPVRVTVGGAAYCASNKLHGFHNVGDVEATYFVVKVGSAPVCQT